mmetsp:Transcript_43948/g.76157  ORF Transcript_43948/g.76157 Transcript_43948/m.76157 type:complete len:110 (+) Transcript_43948:599-928(+)
MRYSATAWEKKIPNMYMIRHNSKPVQMQDFIVLKMAPIKIRSETKKRIKRITRAILAIRITRIVRMPDMMLKTPPLSSRETNEITNSTVAAVMIRKSAMFQFRSPCFVK